MVLLRGAFWLAVVAVFAPREADSGAQNNADRTAPAAVIESVRESALATLSRVKAELQAQDRERPNRGPPG